MQLFADKSAWDYASLVAAILIGGVVAHLAIRKLYRRAVTRIMREGAPVSAVAPNPQLDTQGRLAVELVQTLPSPPRGVERLLSFAEQRQARHAAVLVGALLVCGFAEAILWSLVVEPGHPLLALVEASLLFSLPALGGLLLGRLVGRGQPSELGLWAGMTLGALCGMGAWTSASAVGEVRLSLLVLNFVLAALVGYVLLVISTGVLTGLQTVLRLSPEALGASLASVAVGLWWAYGLAEYDGLTSGWLLAPASAALPALLIAHGRISAPANAKSRSGNPPRLLLLRTFGHARRSNSLLREVTRLWLQFGPVNLIVGPDLATSVLTLDTLVAWLTGRLKSRFVRDPADIAHRISSAPSLYRDGRYRIQEFACLEHTWRAAISTLAEKADAVIMDLRNFTGSNQGCEFEIKTLLGGVGPQRVVFLIDESTDVEALTTVVRQAPARTSGRSAERRLPIYALQSETTAAIRSVVGLAAEAAVRE